MWLTPLSDGMHPLQLTPGQLRKIVRLSKETFRHWRLVLPSLQDKKGRSPKFSPGDAVALMVLRSLTADLGAQIGSLRKISEEVFQLCNSTPWMALETGILQVGVTDAGCKLLRTPKNVTGNEPVLLYPLRPIMEQIRDEFLRTERPASQHELRLPPTAISNRRSNGRRT
jgi:hypothetical protein